MKIILLHCDFIKFKPLKKALKNPEELSAERLKEINVTGDPLVVLISVEKGDDKKDVLELVKNIEDVAGQVKAKNIVLYPYAHLSSNLSSPDTAIEVLIEAEKELIKMKYKVVRAPFGYYKEFELKVKGHPLSELSRSFGVSVRDFESSSIPRQLATSPTSHSLPLTTKSLAHPEDSELMRNRSGGKQNEEKIIDHITLLKSISKSVLDRSKLKDNDHRILGAEMDLFSFSEVAPGMVFWHNNGLIIYNELIAFSREILRKNNYKEIKTPEILDKKLWLISGHWDKYRENIFLSEYEDRAFASRPMNCPGGLIVYRNQPKSYKELPLRVAEFGIVHRQELSGVLAGLFRVIEFTQDDAHIFCTEEQIEGEVSNVIKLMEQVYSTFGFSYAVELSTRPEKRIGSDAIWDKAENALEKVLTKNKIKFKLNKGDGAFYGPKIDFHLKDSLGRTWQCGTIQLDFSMPERFELEYSDNENKHKRPVMIHRAVYGSVERFIGILLEHSNGRLPMWLAPKQVRVLSFTDRSEKYGEKVIEKIMKEIPTLRIDKDYSQSTIQSKVKEAEILKVPYIVTVGDREEKDETLAVRIRGDGKLKTMKVDEFVKMIKKEIEERK
ncbi:threonine--tRNA ligase [Candidatus Pacearchaeota archaeon CG10_big_fil_rev_8_21_14_0_10_32_14]|nr:MAG: threonine--tRNA ligase [Candidatus Pacearchaeota archaeon CG10_big_fil_rev_8_21_14_0_10_32_14]